MQGRVGRRSGAVRRGLPESALTKFDRIFLNELIEVIISSYNIQAVTVHAGKLSSDLAAHASNAS